MAKTRRQQAHSPAPPRATRGKQQPAQPRQGTQRLPSSSKPISKFHRAAEGPRKKLRRVTAKITKERAKEDDEDEDDPRGELIRRLQEYERFKQAAMDIDTLERLNRNFWIAMADAPETEVSRPLPDIQLHDLLIELSRVLKRAESFSSHHISLEPLSTRERMSSILDAVSQAGDHFLAFSELFRVEEGRSGVIVTFISLMELIKESLVEIVQSEPFAPIHVKAHSGTIEPVEPSL